MTNASPAKRTRLLFLAGIGAAALLASGCTSGYETSSYAGQSAGRSLPALGGLAQSLSFGTDDRSYANAFDPARIYAARYDGEFAVSAAPWRAIPASHRRTRVNWSGSERPGTIVIEIDTRHLYLVESGGTAMRYGIAVGKEGFGWTGTTTLARKAAWPRWNPPAEMIERKPELAEYVDGMDGGPQNPIGARALYLHKGGKDTLYRIHGTNDPRSIGRAASSGCFRMINQDVIDLYGRVGTGGKVIVRSGSSVVASL